MCKVDLSNVGDDALLRDVIQTLTLSGEHWSQCCRFVKYISTQFCLLWLSYIEYAHKNKREYSSYGTASCVFDSASLDFQLVL